MAQAEPGVLPLCAPRSAAPRRAPAPELSRPMLAVIVLTFLVGLPADRVAGLAGELAVSVWTWILFLVLLARIDPALRRPLLLCLAISTLGECVLSLLWGLYTYWLQNIPPFVPPGHVLLFALGLWFTARLPHWGVMLVATFAASYGMAALWTGIDTFSAATALLFLLFIAFGKNRKLYATMFLLSLAMELYGTWIGNWAWVPHVPGVPLTSANPPLCVGGLYCALDLLVVNADRIVRRWREPAGAAAQARSAA